MELEKFYKVEAEDDVVYIRATSREEAESTFKESMGDDFPMSMLKWGEVDELPSGETFL